MVDPMKTKRHGRDRKKRKRAKLVLKYAERRKLTSVLKDPNASLEEKYDAQRKIAKMPRDASATRYKNRCALTAVPVVTIASFVIPRHAPRRSA